MGLQLRPSKRLPAGLSPGFRVRRLLGEPQCILGRNMPSHIRLQTMAKRKPTIRQTMVPNETRTRLVARTTTIPEIHLEGETGEATPTEGMGNARVKPEIRRPKP